MSKRFKAVLQTASILFLMSVGTVITKMALADVPPFTFAWMSILIGMITLATFTFVVRREQLPRGLDRYRWFQILVIGVCNVTISRLTRPLALQALPVTTTVYVANFTGFVTMGMSCLLLREIPLASQVLGAAITVFGLTVYFQDPLMTAEVVGILLVLSSVFAVAYSNNIARKVGLFAESRLSNNVISTTALLVGGGIVVIAGFVLDFPPKKISLRGWAIIVYSGIFNVALGLTIWNYVLRTLRSYEASILGGSTIIWSTLLAMALLEEQVEYHQWLGMAAMLLGLVLVQTRVGDIKALFSREV